MKKAAAVLKEFGVDYCSYVLSAHRSGELLRQRLQEAEAAGCEVIIAGAGLAAHLPGVIASMTVLPVIGVPVAGGALNGLDALYATVQMPSGVPVATVAVGSAGPVNAALLAVQMLSISEPSLVEALNKKRAAGAEKVLSKDREISAKYSK